MADRKRRLRVRAAQPAAEPEEQEEIVNTVPVVDEDEIDDEPIRQARRILRKGEKFKDEGPEEEIIEPEPEPEPGKVVFSTDPMTDVLNDLKVGHAVVITREDKEKYSMRVLETDEFSAKPTMSKAEYLGIVYTEAYTEFERSWGVKSAEERLAYAKKKKIEWDEHDDHRINMLRLTQAVREAEGIEKYKPEWNTKAKRSKIRPKR